MVHQLDAHESIDQNTIYWFISSVQHRWGRSVNLMTS